MSSATQIANRYQLYEKLGQGGMGAVYRAYDRLTGSTIALKRVLSDLDMNFDQTTPLNMRLNLSHEFRTLATLRHPNIISVLDYGFDRERQPFFTMNLLPDPQPVTLAAPHADTAQKTRWLIEMLQALAYLHRQGVIHRDLKPANVLVSNDQVQVLDFGLAQRGSLSPDEAEDSTAGTLAYMSPEQLKSEPASVQSDLYAVGMMAYELFLGRYPFDTRSTTGLIRQILEVMPDIWMIKRNIGDVLHRLLAKSPAERYPNADEAIAALCAATGFDIPHESAALRESYLQAAQFVGRREQLQTLTDALNTLTREPGHGAAWLIGGESGTGKSRLMEELRIRGLVNGANVVRGQAQAGSSLPLQVWREPARRLLLAAADRLSPLEIGILRELVPDAAAVVGQTVPDVPPLEGDAQRNRLRDTVVKLFRLAATDQPVLLLLEDLQWAEDSLAILNGVIRLTGEARLLMIGSFRDDEAPTLPDQLPGATSIKLPRLSDAEVAELSESMLGAGGRKPALLGFLQRESEGNAFFLVEIMRTLAEGAGRLGDIANMTLPAKVVAGGVQEVIRRRLARIPESARQLLRVAALIGRQPDLAVLQALIARGVVPDLETDLDGWLTTCANVAILEIADERWRFTHDKLREAILRDFDESARADYHRHIAEVLEALYPTDSARAGALMEHWQKAGHADREAHYAILAGERALAVSDYPNAERYTTHAITLIEAGGAPDLTGRLAALYSRLGDTIRLRGDYDQALAWIEKGIMHAHQNGQTTDLIDALVYRGITLTYPGRITESLNALDEAIRLARKHSYHAAAAKAIARMVSTRAIHDPGANPAELLTLLDEGIALSEVSQNAVHKLRNLTVRGIILAELERWDEAVTVYRETLQLATDLGDRATLLVGLNNFGEILKRMGRLDEYVTYAEQALNVSREIGHGEGMVITLFNMAETMSDNQRYEEALDYIRELLIVARRGRARLHIEYGIQALAYREEKRGALARAVELLGMLSAQTEIDENRDDAEKLLATIQPRMDANAYQQALERGRTLDFERTVTEILR
jgi:eukaryotic-like serine/threonine-protein kinase